MTPRVSYLLPEDSGTYIADGHHDDDVMRAAVTHAGGGGLEPGDVEQGKIVRGWATWHATTLPGFQAMRWAASGDDGARPYTVLYLA